MTEQPRRKKESKSPPSKQRKAVKRKPPRRRRSVVRYHIHYDIVRYVFSMFLMAFLGFMTVWGSNQIIRSVRNVKIGDFTVQSLAEKLWHRFLYVPPSRPRSDTSVTQKAAGEEVKHEKEAVKERRVETGEAEEELEDEEGLRRATLDVISPKAYVQQTEIGPSEQRRMEDKRTLEQILSSVLQE